MIYPNLQNSRSNWLSVPGNEIEYKYYEGTEPSSGGTTEIAQIIYKADGFVRFCTNIVYDANGKIVKQYTTSNVPDLNSI